MNPAWGSNVDHGEDSRPVLDREITKIGEEHDQQVLQVFAL